MTPITGADVLALHADNTKTNAVLTALEGDGPIVVAERTQARTQGWPIFAYRSDLIEQYPTLTPEQADSVAAQLNEARANTAV